MTERQPVAPILVFTYGNPSRGDDALGPAVLELLEAARQEEGGMEHVELLTDFQLQVEHAVDLQGRRQVLFVDASLTARPPWEFHRLEAAREFSYTTHAMSPAALLSVYRQVYRQAPPAAWMLSLRGYEFGLGQPLSPLAQRHLQQGLAFVRELLARTGEDAWRQQQEGAGSRRD